MAKIKLPDGNLLELQDGVTAKQVAERIGASLAKAAIAARVNGQLVDLSTPISGDASIQIITAKDTEAIEILRHSCAHIMAQAICSIWPKARLVYGPTVQDGFYYDIDLDEPIRPTDFERIEEEMSRIVKADKPFIRKEMTREEALKKLEDAVGQLETGDLPLEKALAIFERGIAMSRLCAKQLEEAEQKVELLIGVSEEGQPQTTAFDTTQLEE